MMPLRMPLALVLISLSGSVAAQQRWTKQTELYPAEGYGVTDNYFGASLAVSDGLALIGAPGLDADPGAAYLFERQGGSWVQAEQWWSQVLDDEFGTAVALSADTALVGAPGHADGAGEIHVLTKDGSTWSHGAHLELSPPVPQAYFGAALVVEGNTGFAGAPGMGAVYSFERIDGAWMLGTQILPSSVEEGFGASLDFDGTRLVVGSPEEDAVYVFERAGPYWYQTARLVSGLVETELGDFGYSVALEGSLVLVGAPGDSGEGRAFLFEHGPAGWSLGHSLEATGVQPDMEFGTDVALSPNIIVVGSPGDGMSLGAAYVFERLDSAWVQTAQLVPDVQPGEVNYAYNVAVVENTIMLNIGLDESPVFGVYAGAIQVWLPSPQLIRRAVGASGPAR